MSRIAIFIGVLVFASGCSIGDQSSRTVTGFLSKETREEASKLTEAQAIERAHEVGQVSYDLNFNLGKESEGFKGTIVAEFEYTKIASPKFPFALDFTEGQILAVEVNGKKINDPKYNGFFLELDRDHLESGKKNQVKVQFSHPYSKTGSGLYRFKDPEDSTFYLYTDFQPYDANRLFPHFDQPDLKATFKLEVNVPEEWVVVSSVRESEVKVAQPNLNRRIWVFPESKLFSSYLFSLHAGDYHIIEDSSARIPSRLLVRKSLKKYVNDEEWFKITRQGFDFFEKYFDYKYPFAKYDQLIVPDFNAGAMENVGAVTFSERFVKRGEYTRQERERIASVIMHEMAHMWFGNLVTTKWWNGLWLNESFATYMATLALAESTEYKESWKTFYQRIKQWAYWEDQLVTTHPIEAKVPNTDQAFANFDGITYGKGAASLKQLSYLIGPERFRNGVREYFKKHAFKNAELKDFIGALESASAQSLTLWTKQWLTTKSLNTVELRYTCKGGKIADVALHQSGSEEFNEPRVHKTQVGLYQLKGDKIIRTHRVGVKYESEVTPVPSLKGVECPLMAFPNDDDYDYVKVKLDRNTIEAAKQGLFKVENSFLRAMLWQSLWDGVRSQEISTLEFADLVIANIPAESDIKILDAVGRMLVGRSTRSSSVLFYLPQGDEAFAKFKNEFVTKTEKFIWSQLEKEKRGSDYQKLWLDRFKVAAKSKWGRDQLVALVSGKAKTSDKLEIDTDRRWGLIERLAGLGDQRAEALAKTEIKKDSSERGQKWLLRVEAAKPDLQKKKDYWEKVVDQNTDLSLGRRREIMGSLFPGDQLELHAKFADQFYSDLPSIMKKDSEYAGDFSNYLVPSVCAEESADRIGQFVESNPNLPEYIAKNLKVAKQEDERCVQIRNRSAQAIRNRMSLVEEGSGS